MTAPQPLSFWVRTLDTLLQAEFARAAEAAGIDREQWQVLTRLRVGSVADDVLQEGLAPFVGKDHTVDDVVDRTIKDGLVEHQANEYRLTPRGIERVDELEDKALGEIHDRAFEGLSQDDLDRLGPALERMATNLGWQPA
jgi:DNA-binding MarR family transcriptional regulator